MIFSTSKIIALLLQYKYAILFPIAVLEGPVITVICGFLISSGHLMFLPVYGIVMLGDLVGDVFWYHLGYYYGHRFVKKFGKRFGLTEERVAKAKEKFHTHKHSILVFSKLTNGLGLAVAILFTAGIAKIPFRRYIIVNILGQLVWSGMLITIGYFFGNVFASIESVELKVLLAVCVIIGIFFAIKYVQKAGSKISS